MTKKQKKSKRKGSKDIIRYDHDGELVSVRRDLKGKERKYDLCHICANFYPDLEDNCKQAKAVYKVAQKYNLVLPVWECPAFKYRTKLNNGQ